MKRFLTFIFCLYIPLIQAQYITKIASTNCATKSMVRPYEKNGRYYNHKEENAFKQHVYDALQIFYHTKTESTKYLNDNLEEWKAFENPLPLSIEPTVQWIGHSSFLIQTAGYNIITDPVFYDLSLYSRTVAPGISPENLPYIDMIIISHNHRDHLDEKSLKALKKFNPIVLVPEGLKTWFKKAGFTNVIESSWWDQHTFKNNKQINLQDISLTFVPAKHWCQRRAFDTNQCLWGGWIIQDDTHTIYFAGDTGYEPKFLDQIAQTFNKIDIALLPIGPCEPRKYTEKTHMNSEDASRAFVALGAKHFIPMHWGTFRMSKDGFIDPIKRLKTWWHMHTGIEVEQEQLHILKFGERISFPD